jgi:hypothetical protein
VVTKINIVKKMKRRKLAEKFFQLGFTKGVEVGVRTGKFSSILCQQNPKLKLYSVDPFDVVVGDYRSNTIGREQQRQFFHDATKLLKPYNCKIIRKESIDAVRDFNHGSLDFVYIDGSHEFDWIMTDIIEWGKRVKTGGIISGHDYYKFRIGNVVDAVNAYTYAHKVKNLYLTDERTPSFWFTKEWK